MVRAEALLETAIYGADIDALDRFYIPARDLRRGFDPPTRSV
jgi:hypothetical protein